MSNNRNRIHPLKAERERQNLSQVMLCAETGLSPSTIKRAERGDSISAQARKLICDYFRKSSVELGLIDEPTSEESTSAVEHERYREDAGGDDTNRRQMLKLVGMTGAAVATGSSELLSPGPWEQLSKALQRSTYIDQAALDNLEAININYWHLRLQVPARDLMPSIVGQLQTVSQMLRGSLDTHSRSQLCIIAGKISMVLGEMSMDLQDFPASQGYFGAALDAGKESGEANAYAIAIGRMGQLQNNMNRPQNGVVLLREIHRIPEQHMHPSLIIWAFLVEAEANALAGNVDGCIGALEHAKDVASMLGINGDPFLTDIDLSSIPAYEGACYLHLKQPQKAIPALQTALTTMDTSNVMRRGIILSDVAAAYAQAGEVQESCIYGSQALDITAHIRSGFTTKRMQKVRQQLDPWDDMPAVRALDEQILLTWRN